MWLLKFFTHTPPVVAFYHDIEQNIDSPADVADCCRAVDGFLRLEAKYRVPATYNVVGRLLVEQPDLVRQIQAAGQEIAFHSYHHYPDWQPKYYEDEVRRCRRSFSGIAGYRSPRSDWDENTVRACWEEGFLWNAESDRAREPYFVYRDLVRLPIAGDDWPVQTGRMNTGQWVESFRKMLRRRSFVAFGCHDCVAAGDLEQRLAAWDEILRRAVEAKATLVNFSQAAELWKRRLFHETVSATPLEACEV